MIKNLDDCIDLIKRQNELDDLSKQDIEELLKLLRPYLIKKYGKELMIQVERLIQYKNFERTVKLLNMLPKRRIPFIFRSRLSKFFFMTMMIGAGITFAILGYYDITNSKDSNSWPSTIGEIIKSRVGRRTSLNNEFVHDYADIQYNYMVKSKKYTSNRVSFANSENPVLVVKRYPVGWQVNVFYNPDNPKVSVLEPGFSDLTYMWLGGAVIFFFLSFIFIRIEKRVTSE